MKRQILRALLITVSVGAMVPAAHADIQAKLYEEYQGRRELCQNYQEAPDGITKICHDVVVAAPPAPPAPEPAPAPAPPPPPQPVAESKSYTIYFGVGKSNLTAEGQSIVAQAAREASELSDVKVKVSGYTSTSSSEGFNTKLSEKRASAVAGALVSSGVTGGNITAEAHGENNLAVPTPDKTEMPANRRVTIDVSGMRTPAQ